MYEHDPNSCVQPRDPDAYLWRVMDLAKFEWLVTKGALYFCRGDRFEDPLDGALPSANRRVERFFGFPIDPDSPKGQEFAGHKERIWAQFRRWTYVNCWYRGDEPSIEMWEKYGAHGTGVAVRSSFARLALALQRSGRQVRISDVQYLDPAEVPVSEISLATAVARKAPCYSFENEVRLFTTGFPTGMESGFWGAPGHARMAIPVTLSHLVSAVAFGPNASSPVQDHVELLLPWGGLVITAQRERPAPAI